jgi:hypothetical protein
MMRSTTVFLLASLVASGCIEKTASIIPDPDLAAADTIAGGDATLDTLADLPDAPPPADLPADTPPDTPEPCADAVCGDDTCADGCEDGASCPADCCVDGNPCTDDMFTVVDEEVVCIFEPLTGATCDANCPDGGGTCDDGICVCP